MQLKQPIRDHKNGVDILPADTEVKVIAENGIMTLIQDAKGNRHWTRTENLYEPQKKTESIKPSMETKQSQAPKQSKQNKKPNNPGSNPLQTNLF